MRERRRVRHRHPLDQRESAEEREEIDLLLLGLSYDFSSSSINILSGYNDDKSKEIEGVHGVEVINRKVAKAWSKLGYVPVPGYELDLTFELFESDDSFSSSSSFIGGGISSHSVESVLSSSLLVLDAPSQPRQIARLAMGSSSCYPDIVLPLPCSRGT